MNVKVQLLVSQGQNKEREVGLTLWNGERWTKEGKGNGADDGMMV